MQDYNISSALAMEILQSCTEPSIYNRVIMMMMMMMMRWQWCWWCMREKEISMLFCLPDVLIRPEAWCARSTYSLLLWVAKDKIYLPIGDYIAVSLWRSQWSHNYSQQTPHNSPVRATNEVPFVDPASDRYSAWVPVIIYLISYSIGPRYNGTRLYMD